jgi:putative ABC transport system permease protein
MIRQAWERIGTHARRTPLAWRNVVHNKISLLVSTAAVAFAVVIMFMELGFLNGLYDSQTSVLTFLRADLVMVSRALHIFNSHETFPRVALEQAAGVDGVKGAYPVYVEDTLSNLRNPVTGIRNTVRVIGFDPGDPIFESRRMTPLVARVRSPLTILFDEKSRPFIGTFAEGMKTELADRLVTVAGNFDLGPDYYYDGNVLMSADTLFTLFPNQHRSGVFIGLIQLKDGASLNRVLKALRDRIGPEVEIMKKSEIVGREKASWQKSTPAGYVFTMGVAVGFVIGVFICYQILYTDIADHLPQLATLKALGYQDRDLVRIVLAQAALLGLLGFLPAVLMTVGLYSMLTAITGIITHLTLGRIALVLFLTLGMCFVGGLLAVRRAIAVDPAELF